MTVPVAVSPGVVSPGLYLLINLIAGAASPSVGTLKTLLISPISSGGDLTVDSEIRAGGGADSAGVAFGIGTPGHLAAKQLYAAHPTAVVDFAAPTAGAGTATLNVTFTGVPTGNNTVRCVVKGVQFDVAWLAAETADDIKTKVIDAINQRDDLLPVVASTGGVGIAQIDGKVTGNISNDVRVKFNLLSAQTGTEAVDTNTLTNLAGGSADPDLTTILAAAAGEEYHFILPCLSNADAVATGGSANPDKTVTHIELYNSGLDAKLQQLVYASTTTLATAKAGVDERNVGYAQHKFGISMQSLPCEFAGAEAGDRLAAISIDPAANRIGNRLGGAGEALYGSDDTIADKPTTAELEDGLTNGVSVVTYDSSGNLIASRPITTYHENASGGPDRRLLDTQNVDATYIIARDLRSALPAEFPNAKITPDTLPGQDPPPAGVIEERDIKGFVISRLRFWQRAGVVDKAALDEVIANGELIVQVNASDPSQVDIVIPIRIVPGLAKFGVVINRTAA